MSEASRRALFLDRDGTIIEDAHYLADADRLRLLPGAAAAIARANRAGLPVFVITNQSGIGRGLITPQQYAATEARLLEALREAGAYVDGVFHCPHAPGIDPPCSCRKPGLGLFRAAADRYDLRLEGSLFVGDKWRDVEPALDARGIGVLVRGVETADADVER